MKKLLSVLFVFLVMLLPLSANGASETDGNTEGLANSQAPAPTLNPDGSFHLPISEEPETFSIFLNFNNSPFNSNWPVWQELSNLTNVSFTSVISQSNSNETEAFNLMLSSGDLADVIGYVNASDLEKLGRDGGLIPLNDLINQYAPNIKRLMEEDPRFKQYATSTDGNIYFIPKNQVLKACEFWWIRKDWLDKLGLEIPTTVDELYEVLSAFRNEDPNGNGIKDEIPLFDRAGWKMPDEYLYLWDTSLGFYVRDGEIIFEPLEENFETGVKNMKKWYEEGLIDPEIFTRGSKSRDILFSGDIGGCTHDWVSTSDYNDKLADVVPGFEVVVMAPPADHNGLVRERTERFPSVGWGISSQCKDPITVIKFMDFLFTETGSNYMNWGIEGETYYEQDGHMYYTDQVLESDLTPTEYLKTYGCLYRVGMNQDSGTEMSTLNEYGVEAYEMYEGHPEWFNNEAPPYADGQLDMKYFPEIEARYQRIMASIEPYVKEMFQSWILGTSDFDETYPEFVKELDKRGIQEAIEINQIAYDYYIESAKVE